MKRLLLSFILLMLFFSGLTQAQKISITALNLPLSEFLVQLRDKHGASVSFDDAALRKFTISVNKSFNNIEDALKYALENLPVNYTISNNVFVIYPDPGKLKPKPEPQKRVLMGQVLDSQTLESLPFTNILINGSGTISDDRGFFSYTSTDSVYKLALSQIGYYRKDTLFSIAGMHRILLTPGINELKEVVVSDNLIETFVYTEKQAGVVRLNHKITRFLPGSSDNSVFNLLRLQSGILASAESSDDLLIWGSYIGQSRVFLDGFLLFGLKNFNDNISAVNPFVVKDIKVLKAGFDATYGKCVGGIADITGFDGNKTRPGMQVSLNNYTINALVETPTGKNSSLIMAFRHTFHNLYDPKEIDFLKRSQGTLNTIEVTPDYVFKDANLKYHYNNPNKSYVTASMLLGQDVFSYDVDEDITERINVKRTTKEENQQRGGSFVVGKMFSNGWHTRLKMTYSQGKTVFDRNQQVAVLGTTIPSKSKTLHSDNSTSEATLAWENQWPLLGIHKLATHIEWTKNTSKWVEDTLNFTYIDQRFSGRYMTIVLSDEISSPHVNLKPGLRYSFVPFLRKSLVEPRISLNVPVSGQLDFNLSAGLYNQILSKSSIEDESGNFRYMWTLANDSVYPVLQGKHVTAAVNVELNKTQVSWAPYFRKTEGLTRYINYARQNREDISDGKGRSYGFDVYIKQNFKGHTAWVSYTLSKTEELFSHFQHKKYHAAPQDQRHEIKFAGLLNFEPVYFSVNYVYVSGFAIYTLNNRTYTLDRTPYIRLDMALIYKFRFQKITGETGISVLNAFNRANILYHNIERVPTEQTNTIRLYEESVPFTPTIYLKVAF